MRGFQPQHYADGGLVQRALGLIGGRKKQIDEAVKVASQDTRQASAPAPSLRLTDGVGLTRWAQSVCFQDGGHVLGTVEPVQSLG